MNKRDKAIISDLLKFRCMSRNDIVDIYFSSLKDPIKSANTVLKRLVRDGHITCSKEFSPYVYFHSDTTIKKDSFKIPHFLEIVKVYRDMIKIKQPALFTVEPKYGKGKDYMEPDIFCIWNGAPLWIEVQRSMISDKAIQEKIERYENYYYSSKWTEELWQPRERNPIFPSVVFVTHHRFKLESDVVRFKQVNNVNQIIVSSPQHTAAFQSTKKGGLVYKID